MHTQHIVDITGIGNEEFLDAYARPGRVGLAGGSHWIDKAIRRMERRVRDDRASSAWSHAFLFGGRRLDGHHWLLESDLDIHKKLVRLGVQENRIAKYSDAVAYPNLAVLDFHLSDEQAGAVV